MVSGLAGTLQSVDTWAVARELFTENSLAVSDIIYRRLAATLHNSQDGSDKGNQG